MECLEPLDLSVAKRPVMLDSETVGITTGDVGLYSGKDRLRELDSGTLYITSHRILWVDELKGNGVQLQLSTIQEVDSKSGFLRSSPKIILRLHPSESDTSPAKLTSSTASSVALATSSISTAPMLHLPGWICEICETANTGDLAKCALCGVPNTRAGQLPTGTLTTSAANSDGSSQPSTAQDDQSRSGSILSLKHDDNSNSAAADTQPDWTCEICEAANPWIAPKCAVCGVPNNRPPSVRPRPPAAIGQPTSQTRPTNSSLKLNVSQNRSDSGLNPAQIQCPACTFLNDSQVKTCEMCDTLLLAVSASTATPNSIPTATTTSESALSPKSTSGIPALLPVASIRTSLNHLNILGAKTDASINSPTGPILKLSFRNGGMAETLKHLRQFIAEKTWEIKKKQDEPVANASVATEQASGGVGGIASIMRTVEQNKRQMDESVDDAFSDLTRLMEKASEMVKLAESISAKIANTPASNDTPEMVAFRTYLKDLGISNPVTRASAGDMYTDELSRQLADFIDRLYSTGKSDMVSLTDLYCLFNRARGVALISPEDLWRAASGFERLRLPFRLRKFDSGLLVVQSDIDDAVAARILALLEEREKATTATSTNTTTTYGLTAIELARHDNISIVLAAEQLLMTEHAGLTCRDDTQEGLFFYPNRFVVA